MTLELCTDSYEGALIASQYGLKRIELCSALEVGGLTPSYGLIKQCTSVKAVETHVMIRPRAGDFNYNTSELEQMIDDIMIAEKLGAKGVVFGILNRENKVSQTNKILVDLSQSLGLETTFHRAFDFVTDYHQAVQQLMAFGFTRVLTSGLKPIAEAGLNIITNLQHFYGDKIQIMAGSGINPNNALLFAQSGIKNLHFTARQQIVKQTALQMGGDFKIDADKIKSIVNIFL